MPYAQTCKASLIGVAVLVSSNLFAGETAPLTVFHCGETDGTFQGFRVEIGAPKISSERVVFGSKSSIDTVLTNVRMANDGEICFESSDGAYADSAQFEDFGGVLRPILEEHSNAEVPLPKFLEALVSKN